MTKRQYELLDPALEPLRALGPLLKNGFVNHAPMVAEALVAMGQDRAHLGGAVGGEEFLAQFHAETGGRSSAGAAGGKGQFDGVDGAENRCNAGRKGRLAHGPGL